jgi:hypothetical protein
MQSFFLVRLVGGVESNWVHSARRPLIGLLYLPRVIMMMENFVEWRLAGETEVLGENLLQRHFVHHKSQLTRPRDRTQTAAVGSQRLTAWVMVRPTCNLSHTIKVLGYFLRSFEFANVLQLHVDFVVFPVRLEFNAINLLLLLSLLIK